MKIVAITACVTGVAHTYMAAAALAKAAKTLGYDLKVETQGALGLENELSAADIAGATVAIIAADTSVQKRERFQNIRVYEAPVAAALKDPKRILIEALAAVKKDEA